MLSLVFPAADPGVTAQLRELRKLLGPGLPIVVGGHSSLAYRAVLAEIGAQVAGDTDSLGEILGSL